MSTYYRKFWLLFRRRERVRALGLFFLMLLNAVIEMAGIGMVPAFIMVMASPEAILEHVWARPVLDLLGIHTSRELLLGGAVALASFFVLRGLLQALIQSIHLRFLQGKYRELSQRLFSGYMRAPYLFHLDRNSSELMRNVINETHKVVFTVFSAVLNLMLNALAMIFIVALLLAAQPLFSAITLVVLGGVSFLIMHVTKKKTGRLGREEMEHRGKSYKTVLEGLAGFRDIRLAGRENHFLRRYGASVKRILRSQYYRQMLQVLQRPALEAIVVSGVLVLAVWMTIDGYGMSRIIALLALYAAAAFRLLPQFRQMLNNITTLRYHIYSVGPVYDDLQRLRRLNDDHREDNEPQAMPFLKELAMENVSFTYPNRKEPAVKDISLKVPQGKAVALTGLSGAGKTTLVNILLGLLTPQQGTVTVDGSSVAGRERQWQKNTGYVPQDVYLADDTLKHNVALGLEDHQIDEQRLQEAVKAAQLEELINRLPQRENTVLGERGITLSGGERQRVAIARALYHNPKLLIMDEGTSALDTITEQYISDAIGRLKGERTIVMIAHRISTVVHCDHICLMDEGRIVAEGTYHQLLDSSPQFRKMAGNAQGHASH